MAISLRRMMMRLMGFGIVVVLVLAVSSSSTTSENDDSSGNNAKANSWIIKGPTRPIRPGLGLPPGGMLLMTMDPNATMPDAMMMNETQEASSQPPATELSITSEEPVVGTEASGVDQQDEPEVTTASSAVAESEQPASEEPLSGLVESSSSLPLSTDEEEELVTTQPEEAPATDVASVVEGTESPQHDTAEVENIQPEVEGSDASDLTHQDLITTEQPEAAHSDETLSTAAPEEPVVAALAQGISGVTTLVPEELAGSDESQEHQDPQAETSHDSQESEQLSADVVHVEPVVSDSSAPTTESDIVEVDIGNGIFADTTLVQVGVPDSDPEAELEGSGLVSDLESGSGQDIHLPSDDGSGSDVQIVTLDTSDDAAESGSGDDGSGDVVQDLPAGDVPVGDSHSDSEVPAGDVAANDSHSDSEVQAGNVEVDDSHSETEVAVDVPADNSQEEHSADLVAHEEPSESQTTEPAQDVAEQDIQTESTPTDASSESTPEEPIAAETTEAEPQTTPFADEAEPVRLRRDAEETTEPKAAHEESTSDNQAESEHSDDEQRQFRPYPIRGALRRPFYPQRNGPVHNEYGVISRTAEFCYTMWCRFKTSLRRLL